MLLNSPSQRTHVTAHLVHRQIDAGVGDDSQHVGDVALIKSTQPFSPQYLLGTVGDAGVLSSLPQSKAGFQHLGAESQKDYV